MAGVYFKASEILETLDEYKGEKGKFLKTFALNDKRNKNGWRAVWEGTKRNIHTFKDKPGIEFMKCDDNGCDLDHTEAQTEELSLQVQETYRKTNIIDWQLNEGKRTAYFIHEVLDNQFWDDVKSGKIKFVSPSIWPKSGGYEVIGKMENGLPMIDVWDWSGLHDAFVNKPAFGDEAKITATCEGEGCPVKLLTAVEKIVMTSKAESNYRLAKEGEGACYNCAFFNEKINRCSAVEGMIEPDHTSDRFQIKMEAVTDPGGLEHLQEIPLSIVHNKKRRFISVTKGVYEAVTAALKAGEHVDESKVFDLIRQEQSHSSFSSCTCSGNQNMPTDEEYKDAKAKLKAAEEEKEDMKAKLKANEDEDKKDMEARKARLVATLKGMSEDERAEHAKSIRAMDDEKEKVAMDEAEKEVKTAKKGMTDDHDKSETAMEHENKEMKASIKLLEENEALPLVAKMVRARELKGATEEEIKNYTTYLGAKELKEIKQLYANEEILIESLVAKEPEAELKHFDFGGQGHQLSAKSFGEIFQEPEE